MATGLRRAAGSTPASPSTSPSTAPRVLEFAVSGMTCTACAARIQRKLDRMDGVCSSVSYAAERATVTVGPGVDPDTITAQIERTGYGARLLPPAGTEPKQTATEIDAGARLRDLRRRLWVAVLLSIPLCNFSLGWALVESTRIPYWQLVLVALALPVVTWAAWPFHRAALRNARHGSSSMDTLVSLGIVSSTAWSLIVMFSPQPAASTPDASGWDLLLRPTGALYLDVASGVVTFLLVGRLFEARARRLATGSLRALAGLGASQVTVLEDDGREHRLPVTALRVGMRFVVRPGETVAADGEVVEGHSTLDCSRMTGESLPVEAGPGSSVLGGTLGVDGRLVVRATSVGEDTQLAHMVRLVEQTQADKAKVQRLVDRISGVFVPFVLVLAGLTFSAWLLSGAATMRAVGAGIAVLIIACPCALGLATPTALMVASGVAADRGLFLGGHQALESARDVDTVVLDKTGTVTTGRMRVVGVAVAPDADRARLLRCAGSVESGSQHGIGVAVTRFATAEVGTLPAPDSFTAQAGYGVTGRVRLTGTGDMRTGDTRTGDGIEVDVVVGRRQLLIDAGIEVPEWAAEKQLAWEHRGRSVALVAIDGSLAGLIAVADTVKKSAGPALAALRDLGLRVILLTGDNEHAAKAVVAELGVRAQDVVAGVLPTGKVEVVRRLQAEGHAVAMVGDGVNDAPALAAADLSMAVGSGTDVARNAADLVLVRDDLTGVPFAVRLARGTLRTIRGNLAWAFGYNVAALPLAAAGWLNPLVAGATMTLSSMFVLSNSLRLQSRFGTRRSIADEVARSAKGSAPASVPR